MTRPSDMDPVIPKRLASWVRYLSNAACREVGSARELHRATGLSEGYISDVVLGKRQTCGLEVLLKLRRIRELIRGGTDALLDWDPPVLVPIKPAGPQTSSPRSRTQPRTKETAP